MPRRDERKGNLLVRCECISGMNSERAIFGEVSSYHRQFQCIIHSIGPFTTAIRRSFGRRSLGCYLLPTPPMDGHHAGFRGTHDILAERPSENRPSDRPNEARTLALGSRQQPTTESDGRRGDRPSIPPPSLPAAPAEQEISNLSDNNKASHARTLLPLRRTKTGSEQLERGGTICHIIRKTIARLPMPGEGGRRLSSKGALFPIELLTSKRRGREGRREDEKRREGKRGDV